jgi:hypothetical protein
MGRRIALTVSVALVPTLLGCNDRGQRAAPDAAPVVPVPVPVVATASTVPIVDAGSVEVLDAAPGPVDAGVDGATVLHGYRRVLHIGDSMVGYKFGLTRALGARFEADGAKFFSIPVTSAGIQSFEKNQDLDDAIKKTRPDLVILTLGANNATSPQPQYLVPAIKHVVKKVGLAKGVRRRCFWMGPPLWKPDTVGFVNVLAKATEPCTFFDSSKLPLERMGDGIHPTNKGGEVWAAAFHRFLIEQLAADPSAF